MPEILALLLAGALVVGLVIGPVLLIRSACPALRLMGWLLGGVLVLCVGLAVFTQAAPNRFSPDYFDSTREKFPDGGLEVGFSG